MARERVLRDLEPPVHVRGHDQEGLLVPKHRDLACGELVREGAAPRLRSHEVPAFAPYLRA